MKDLPVNVSPYKRTPEFTEESVPTGLLNDHTTKDGVWGKKLLWPQICVISLGVSIGVTLLGMMGVSGVAAFIILGIVVAFSSAFATIVIGRRQTRA